MLTKFFNMLFPDHYIELRAIRLGGGVSGRTFIAANRLDAVNRFCREHADSEVYFGVAPRIGTGHGGLANCAPLACLWADIDFKDTPEPEAREALALMDSEPNIVVHSGGGLHCYWLLEEKIEAWQARQALRRIAVKIGGDMKSTDAAHILRVPGTLNHKYKPPRPVRIEYIRSSSRLSLDFNMVEKPRENAAGAIGSAASLARARAWVAEREPAVEGWGGDQWTFKTCCALIRDFGLAEADALELLLSWNERCDPPWNERELRAKLVGAARYGSGEVGREDPAADFAMLADSGPSEKPENLMEKMSRWFKTVDDGGKLRVYRKRRDELLNRSYWSKYARRDFLEVCKSALHLPMVRCGDKASGDPRYEDAAVHWLDHYYKKTTYSGVTFAPEHDGEKTPDGKLNLWQGFAHEPRAAGSWAMLEDLVYETLCGMDERASEYVLDWLARAVQRPWEPGRTALVFKGPKGTGKGTLGRAFVDLFGQHGMHITSQALLTGRFNIHLRDVCALFADEAFWAGDKAGEGVLKGLITEPTLAYEGKGRDVETGRNCVHLVMASNEDWVVPAGTDNERRYAVFNVDQDNRGSAFWSRLNNELRRGGYNRMLHDLLARDVSGFNPHNIPATTALAEQKIRSLDTVAAWLLEAAEDNLADFGTRVQGMYSTSDVYDSYLRYCDRANIGGRRMSNTAFGIALKKYVYRVRKRRLLLPGSERQKCFYELPSANKIEEKILSLIDSRGLPGSDETR